MDDASFCASFYLGSAMTMVKKDEEEEKNKKRN